MIAYDLLASLPFSDLLTFLWFFVILDVPRYILAAVVTTPWLEPLPLMAGRPPAVTGIIPCHNEEHSLRACVVSMQASHVNQIIVVNDGSADATSRVAHAIPGIEVIDLPHRQGKPEAINQALPHVKGEFVLVADADTIFAPGAVARALACFGAGENVGGVGFCLRPLNIAATLATRIQAVEYTIGFGPVRLLADMLGILSNVSGAAGIFRTQAIHGVQGWDCEVAEDAALAMKLRAAGWQLRYAHDATALTTVPATMPGLLEQRLRWDASIITIWFRKYGWMLDSLSPRYGLAPMSMKFRISNLLTVADVLLFSAVMPAVLPVYLFLMFDRAGAGLVDILMASIMALAAADLFLAILAGLTPSLLVYWPWYFVVNLLVLRPLRIVALISELVFHITRYDPYIPAHNRHRLT